MPSRWDAATHGWSRRVFHYPLPTLMSRNFRLPCTIELQPLSLTLLKMRKVELTACPNVRSDPRSPSGFPDCWPRFLVIIIPFSPKPQSTEKMSVAAC